VGETCASAKNDDDRHVYPQRMRNPWPRSCATGVHELAPLGRTALKYSVCRSNNPGQTVSRGADWICFIIGLRRKRPTRPASMRAVLRPLRGRMDMTKYATGGRRCATTPGYLSGTPHRGAAQFGPAPIYPRVSAKSGVPSKSGWSC